VTRGFEQAVEERPQFHALAERLRQHSVCLQREFAAFALGHILDSPVYFHGLSALVEFNFAKPMHPARGAVVPADDAIFHIERLSIVNGLP